MTNAEIVARSNGDAYHWHIAIVRELERLDTIGELPYPVRGIAGNVKMSPGDVGRAVLELEHWGIATRGNEPRWDYADEWVSLA